MHSEDSDQFDGVPKEQQFKKPPPLVNIRQETTSTESRDTLTPMEHSDNHTLVDEGSNEDIVEMNFEGTFIIVSDRFSYRFHFYFEFFSLKF